MRKLFAPLICIALTAACGSLHTGSRPGTSSQTGAAPLDAGLVTAGFGWVLTPDRLLLTQDGGRTFTDAKPPVPATSARAAFFSDARTGYVVASLGNAVTIARTGDGGRTWQVGAARDATAPMTQYGRLRLSFGDAAHGVILAETSDSAMSSTATLFATQDGGTSWTARKAPAYGEIRMDQGGRTWLAGGVVGDRLYSSADQGGQWNQATIDVTGPVSAKAVLPPVNGILPVTVLTNSDQTQEALLTSPDNGRTWQDGSRVALHGKAGAGVRVPVAFTSYGPLVLDTAGGHAYQRTADVRPSGLPEGSDRVSFAPDGRTGWVLGAYGKCAHGKSDCTLYHPLSMTADGGATWQQVTVWQEKLN